MLILFVYARAACKKAPCQGEFLERGASNGLITNMMCPKGLLPPLNIYSGFVYIFSWGSSSGYIWYLLLPYFHPHSHKLHIIYCVHISYNSKKTTG